MTDAKTLRTIRKLLTELLDSPTLGDATESTDRALDQVNYALEDLYEDKEIEDEDLSVEDDDT